MVIGGARSSDDAEPGFLEGHLKIVSLKGVERDDATPSKARAVDDAAHPLLILSKDGKQKSAVPLHATEIARRYLSAASGHDRTGGERLLAILLDPDARPLHKLILRDAAPGRHRRFTVARGRANKANPLRRRRTIDRLERQRQLQRCCRQQRTRLS
jgi:hypothetical protein